ncbi:hypothetical protein [Nitrosarchaeum sp. AC2]|uniref:hypothetical protein n=1 Tax=Nitrosarchaeum sp. AC2 TaxID=2259673 RepID=UPI0015C92402|nr:hypothetical protein [Nitrosarchaeum sp. AC2]QLH11274.1 hypothetical protein DSQ20_07220 [Nitrosarchaeum sp. AC2]
MILAIVDKMSGIVCKKSDQMESKKKSPKYTGVVRRIYDREIIGKIVLWETNSQNLKSPIFYGNIQTDNGKAYIALWVSRKKEKIL